MTDFLDEFFEYKAQEISHFAEFLEESHHPLLIGIDGRCASGKTTFAGLLCAKLNCPVIHADDFFLRPEQRTEARYAEPGGNMDRERLEEVLEQVKQQKEVTFQRFDCKVMQMRDQITVPASEAVIVEGSYCLHPDLRKYYGLKIFLDVSPEDQMERLKKREPAEKVQMFQNQWIPLEEKYFASCGVQDVCDVTVNSSMKDTEF